MINRRRILLGSHGRMQYRAWFEPQRPFRTLDVRSVLRVLPARVSQRILPLSTTTMQEGYGPWTPGPIAGNDSSVGGMSQPF